MFRSFGTFIDPASKSVADENWPSVGRQIYLTENFMKLMGFGDNTTVAATSPATVDDDFTYDLQISCGIQCNKQPYCRIPGSESPTTATKKYFNGNATKNTILRAQDRSGDAKHKIKLIVCKEWGDKLQVLLHLLKYKLDTIQGSHTLLTADMPVYILCINLSIPCIFTGAHTRPTDLETDKKWYSIMEFKPGTPKNIATTRLESTYANIVTSNTEFINGLKFLKKERIPVLLSQSGNPSILPDKFYQNAIEDLEKLASENKQWFLGENGSNRLLKIFNEDSKDYDKNRKLTRLEKAVKEQCIFIPFIRNCKVLADENKLQKMKGKLVVLSTKYYTKIQKNKPAFENANTSYRTRAFNQLAQIYQRSGGGQTSSRAVITTPTTTGGEGKGPPNFETYFPGDADEPIIYYNSESKVIDGGVGKVDFQKDLFTIFLKRFSKLDIITLQTYYTLFCYNSFINGDTSCELINGETEAEIHNFLLDTLQSNTGGESKTRSAVVARLGEGTCVTNKIPPKRRIVAVAADGGQKTAARGGKKTKKRTRKKKKRRRKKTRRRRRRKKHKRKTRKKR